MRWFRIFSDAGCQRRRGLRVERLAPDWRWRLWNVSQDCPRRILDTLLQRKPIMAGRIIVGF